MPSPRAFDRAPAHRRRPHGLASTVVELLDRLALPFARFDGEGRCQQLSAAAARVLGAEREAFTACAAALSLRLVAARPDARAHGFAVPFRPNPGAAALTLRGVLLDEADEGAAGRVLILLLPDSTSVEAADAAPCAAAGWALTAREREVARLVGAGATNAEVAQALGVSPHTARRHTERVFAKLGVRRRAQLAALVAPRPAAMAVA